MGQNLSLNIASKGFSISVWNRSPDKIEHTLKRAAEEKVARKVTGEIGIAAFVGLPANLRPRNSYGFPVISSTSNAPV